MCTSVIINWVSTHTHTVFISSGEQNCRPTGTTSRHLSHTSRPGSSSTARRSLCGPGVTELSFSSTESTLCPAEISLSRLMKKWFCGSKNHEVTGQIKCWSVLHCFSYSLWNTHFKLKMAVIYWWIRNTESFSWCHIFNIRTNTLLSSRVFIS